MAFTRYYDASKSRFPTRLEKLIGGLWELVVLVGYFCFGTAILYVILLTFFTR